MFPTYVGPCEMAMESVSAFIIAQERCWGAVRMSRRAFTASDDLGSRSTRVLSCTCSCDVVRKPAVP